MRRINEKRNIGYTKFITGKKELSQIKAEEVSIDIMAPKAVFRVVKLFDVHPAAANIIKQEMLAIGGETAVARGCVNMSVENLILL